MVIFYSSARFSTTLTHPTKIPRSLSPRCQEQPQAAMPHRGSCLCVFCCYREVTLGISSNTTTPSPAARPPPEPPPPHSTSLFIFTVASPPADLTTPRPDPKPPWLLSHGSTSPSILLCSKVCVFKSDGVVFLLFYALCFYVYSVVVVSCYVFLFLIVVWIKFAFKVFVERFLLCWLFWKGFFHPDSNSAETWMTTCNIFYSFYRQASIVIMVSLDHRETTHSRTAHILAKEMIRNWIDSKTVDSPSLLAIYHMRKQFVWLIGLVLSSVVNPMWSVLYMCIEARNRYYLIASSKSILWRGFVPTLTDHLVVWFSFSYIE